MALSAFDTICAARMAVYKRLPYFMRMLFKLAPVERPGIGTFFVDEKLRVHYDPDLALRWGVEAVATALAHEVQHPLREHLVRGRRFIEDERARFESLRPFLAQIHPMLAVSCPFFWNVVADVEINPTIDEVGMKFADGFTPVYPKTFALAPGRLAEEYAEELFSRAEKLRQNAQSQSKGGSQKGKSDGKEQRDESGSDGSQDRGRGDGGGRAPRKERDLDADREDGSAPDAPGDDPARRSDREGDSANREAEPKRDAPGSGSCGGCCAHRHELEESVDEESAPSGVTEAEVEIARRQVAHDTLEPTDEMKRLMAQFGIGKVAGSLEAWAKAQLAPPEVPWQKVLAPLVRRAVAYVRGRVDWKFGRPSRRTAVLRQFLKEKAPILPSLVAPVPLVGIVVDTSGSMSAQGRSGRTILNEALSEVFGVVLAAGCPTWVAPVDADVQDWILVRSKKDVDRLVKGGGGTDMRVGIAAAEKKKFDVIVLVTDGYTPWPTPKEMPKRSRLVTCVVGDAAVPKHIEPLVRVKKGGKK